MRKIPLISLNKNPLYQDSSIFTSRERRRIINYYPFVEEKKPHNTSFKLSELLKKKNLHLIQNKDIKNIIINYSKSLHSSKSSSFLLSKMKTKKENNNNYPRTNSMLFGNIKNERNNKYNFPILDFSKIEKSQSQNVSNRTSKKYKKLIFPFIDFSTKDSNYVIKGASDFSRNKSLEKEKEKEKEEIDYTQKISIKNSLRILKAQEKIIKGELNPLSYTKKKYRKKIQDTCFSKVNIRSKKLGSISLFGVFDGHGINALEISKIVKDFFTNYFQYSNTIKVSLNHDNYYSILTEAFINCQNYLINNKDNLGINVDFSGVTCCLVLYPNDSNNNLYCANCGDCKCVLYSNSHFVKLSYPHVPDRPSEAQRILEKRNEFKKNNEYNNINSYNNLSHFNNNNINMNLNNNSPNNDNNNNNNKINNEGLNNIGKGLNYLEKIQEKNKFEKAKNAYLKKFIKLNISRSLGDLQAKELGIISEPEIVESNLKLDRGKVCVLGTLSLWKYLSEEEVGDIVRKHSRDNNTFAACRELEEIARERWKKNMRRVDDITVVIIFLEWKR